MLENLTKLYNTLLLIETKGENTKHMSDCLRFIEQLIVAEKERSVSPVDVTESRTEDEN